MASGGLHKRHVTPRYKRGQIYYGVDALSLRFQGKAVHRHRRQDKRTRILTQREWDAEKA